jgi:hypothetical protein
MTRNDKEKTLELGALEMRRTKFGQNAMSLKVFGFQE